MQTVFQSLAVTTITLILVQIEQVGSAMDVEQEPSTSKPVRTYKDALLYPSSNARQSSTIMEVSHVQQQMSSRVSERRSSGNLAKYYAAKKQCRHLLRDNQELQNQLRLVQKYNQDYDKQNHDLFNYNGILQDQLGSALKKNQEILANLERLHNANVDLKQRHNELKRRYDKKVESYKELDKNYMDLVRPLQVSKDDHSTIYSRLMHIRVSIETLIQKARGEGSANMDKKAAINHFKESKLLDNFPVEEANLEPYHLNLYMESAIMAILIDRFFSRALGCIYHRSKEFEEISKWVEERDGKIAVRWRQQLCMLIAQNSEAMECMRWVEVIEAEKVLSNLVSRVYPSMDMPVKVDKLCYEAFDLSLVMFGMESKIYPDSTPLGTPFDDTTMTTPHKSNPTGTVSLVIFPAFRDSNSSFYMPPKVWCS